MIPQSDVICWKLLETNVLKSTPSPIKGHFQDIAFMEGYTSHIAQVAEVSIEAGSLKIRKFTGKRLRTLPIAAHRLI
jgi:CO/xanthine dehydrogenase Mo-binding subunit